MQQAETVGETFFSAQTTCVGGLNIPALTQQETAILIVEESVKRREQKQPCLYVSAANGQVVSMCARNQKVRELFECADAINADGMSLVFASRLLAKVTLPERVATTDMFHNAARVAEERSASFYFLGGTEEINERTVERVQQTYPGLVIAGRRNGYFSAELEPMVVEAINKAKPDVLWVGMGVPREQEFAVRQREQLINVGAIQTCGGLFDFISGRNSRAPLWMQNAGLEWVYRLMLEPRRLFVRYAVTNPHAIAVMLTRTR